MPSKSKAKPAASKAKTNSTNNNVQSPLPTKSNDVPPKENGKAPLIEEDRTNKGQESHHHLRTKQDIVPSTVSPSLPEVEESAPPGVNRKKQKRRLKEAAKKATLQSMSSGADSNQFLSESHDMHYPKTYPAPGAFIPDEGEEDYYDEDIQRGYAMEGNTYQHPSNGYPNHNYIVQEPTGATSKKMKRKEGSSEVASRSVEPPLRMQSHSFNKYSHTPFPNPNDIDQNSLVTRSDQEKKNRIWNTSTTEERERIKEFWLGLGESERRGLVRIEKEAVLKKMKEQQKHSCSCTVCGRKRTAIEEELEVLYDAYYEELETFANHQHFGLDSSSIPPPRHYARSRSVLPPNQNFQTRAAGQVEELDDDDDSSEEDDEDVSEDELEPSLGPSGGVFNFGNSLTAQGGILTVADDLLKNDGKKFIEMMEQLAERRMQREEESRMVANGMGHPSMRHGPAEEEDDDGYDEEAEDDDYSDEEDEFDDDEMEAMSEEQRMEEGRRMFQIFAARMFEQRVLNAYRQKVAEERQKKLIEELAEDEQLDAQREARKAKEAQKKKDKRQKQKQAKDEEKAKKEAEKAAEEAEARALEERKAEEQRQKREEQRRKKEAEKRALEEEKKRKEEGKQRQLRERKEQQAETERKQRELKENERKKREEARKKEKEDREAKEKTKRDQEDERKQQLPKTQSETITKGPSAKEDALADRRMTAAKRASPATLTTPMQTMTSLQASHHTSAHPSPRLPIATPVLPKPPTPGRVRQRSLQDSRGASPRASQPLPSATASPATSSDRNSGPTSASTRKDNPEIPGPHSSLLSPVQAPPGITLPPPGFSAHPHSALYEYTAATSNASSSATQATPTLPISSPTVPPSVGNHAYRDPNAHFPPGISIPRHTQQGQVNNAGPKANYGFEAAHGNPVSNIHSRKIPAHEPRYQQSHSRNESSSSNISPRDPSQRPAPIQRPSSAALPPMGENMTPSSGDVDDLSTHLGSSALLDDSDDAPTSAIEDLRRGSIPVGGPGTMRQGAFGTNTGFGSVGPNTRMETGHQPNTNMWSSPQLAFGGSNRSAQPFTSAPGFGRPATGKIPGPIQATARPGASRAVRVRILVCTICHRLSQFNPQGQGWHRAEQVLGEVQALMPRNEAAVTMMDMLHICDTEGTAQNGGGHFEFQSHEKVGFLLRYHPDGDMYARFGPPPGEIGSPISGQGGAGSFSHLGVEEAFQPSTGFPSSAGV